MYVENGIFWPRVSRFGKVKITFTGTGQGLFLCTIFPPCVNLYSSYSTGLSQLIAAYTVLTVENWALEIA